MQDFCGGVTCGEGTLPSTPHSDVVEVCSAISVGLGPFAAHCRPKTGGFVLGTGHLGLPPCTGEGEFFAVGHLEEIGVEDDVLVDVEEEVGFCLEFALPVVEAHEAVAEDDDGSYVITADFGDGICGPVHDQGGVETGHARFVGETVHGDDVFIARLSEELGELIMDID